MHAPDKSMPPCIKNVHALKLFISICMCNLRLVILKLVLTYINMILISLGSSCDTKNNLKRIGIDAATLFFDYVWNELNGLKDVTKIIRNNFNYFEDISNYTKTVNHPILHWQAFNINKYYLFIM